MLCEGKTTSIKSCPNGKLVVLAKQLQRTASTKCDIQSVLIDVVQMAVAEPSLL